MVTIPLDPAVAPTETAATLYKIARKQDRTGEAIAPVIEVQINIQYLPSLLPVDHVCDFSNNILLASDDAS